MRTVRGRYLGLRPTARALISWTLVLLLAMSLAGRDPAQSQEVEGPGGDPGGDQVLDEPLNGREAVRALGADLPVVAERNATTAEELRELLLTDSTAWVDPAGRLLFIEDELPQDTGVTEVPTPEETPYPLDETFNLNSKAGAPRVIFLDFNGHTVKDTAWNEYYGVSTSLQPAFDLDGNPGSFNATERALVQNIWQRVAEDYAPFDINVTTQDPGLDAIRRSSSSDRQYGTRALITPSTQAANAICGGGCGGVAYVGVFNIEEPWHSRLQPAWVFSHLLGNNAKYIAEAVSHEVGHNLALWHHGGPDHDGGGSVYEYYLGHGPWAPIMGVGYGRPITQWSRGEYTGATNKTQDDVKVIGEYGGTLRKDDHGDTRDTGTKLGTSGTSVRLRSAGIVSTRSDRDYFTFDQACAGEVALSITPAPVSPNLDLRVRLFKTDGTLIATSNPAAKGVDHDRATGLSASLKQSLPAGTFHVEVDGVGVGTVDTGYSDYASLGAYGVRIDRCVTDTQVTNVAATGGFRQTKVSWANPTSPSFATVEVRTREGKTAPTATSGSRIYLGTGTSVTRKELSDGKDYSFTVFALDSAGNRSPGVSRTVLGSQQTIGRSTSTVTHPNTVTLSGTLTRVDTGASLSGRPVVLQVRPQGGSSWTKLAELKSSSSGKVSHQHAPKRNVEYRLQFSGAGSNMGDRSSVTKVNFRPQVTRSIDRTSMTLGRTATLTGKVRPAAYEGQTVNLERRRSDGSWAQVSSRKLDATNAYSFAIKPSSRGTYTYRVTKPATSRHVSSSSSTVPLKVT
jgi:hypothetical protein